MPLRERSRTADEQAAWKLLLPAVARIANRIQFIEMLSGDKEGEQLFQLFQELVELEESLSELLSFVLPRQYPEFDQIAAHIHEGFADFPEATQKRLLVEISKGWRGRPVVRRHSAAVALAWRGTDSTRTWRQAAERFCVCGKSSHGSVCAGRLKRDALRLKALIRDIEKLPEASHPPV